MLKYLSLTKKERREKKKREQNSVSNQELKEIIITSYEIKHESI